MTTLAEVLAKNRDMLNEVRPVLLVGVDSAGVPTAGTFDAGGQLIVAASAGAAKTVVATARNAYASTSVTTAAWVQIVASTAAAIANISVFDSSGQTLELGSGAEGAEARIAIIPPGGIDIGLIIAQGTRLSLKAISANATVGEHIFQGVG
jgi:hypothetical protein